MIAHFLQPSESIFKSYNKLVLSFIHLVSLFGVCSLDSDEPRESHAIENLHLWNEDQHLGHGAPFKELLYQKSCLLAGKCFLYNFSM